MVSSLQWSHGRDLPNHPDQPPDDPKKMPRFHRETGQGEKTCSARSVQQRVEFVTHGVIVDDDDVVDRRGNGNKIVGHNGLHQNLGEGWLFRRPDKFL